MSEIDDMMKMLADVNNYKDDVNKYNEEKKLILEYAISKFYNIKNMSRYFGECFDYLQTYFENFSISGIKGDSPYEFQCCFVDPFSAIEIKSEMAEEKKQFDNNQYYVKLVKVENDDCFMLVPKGFVNSLLKKSKDDVVNKVTDFIADNFVFKKISSVVFDSLDVDETNFSLEDSFTELKNKYSQPDFNSKLIFKIRVETKDCNSNESFYDFYFILDIKTGLKLIYEDEFKDEIYSPEYYLYQNSFCLLGKANISQEVASKIKPGMKFKFNHVAGHNMDMVINDKIAATGRVLKAAYKRIKFENIVEPEKQECVFDNNNFLILYSMCNMENKDLTECEYIDFPDSYNLYYPVVYNKNIIAQCKITGEVDNFTVEISNVLKEPVAFRE